MTKKNKKVTSEEVIEEFFREDISKHGYNSFEDIFTAWSEKDIATRGYDLYTTHDGNYHCRGCTSIVQHHKNCPKCKKVIDWTKIIVNIQYVVLDLLTDNMSIITNKKIQAKVRYMSNDELMSLYETIYDNLYKQDITLIKATNDEVRKRYIKADNSWKRMFTAKQYVKWNSLLIRTEAKANQFVHDKIHKKPQG